MTTKKLKRRLIYNLVGNKLHINLDYLKSSENKEIQIITETSEDIFCEKCGQEIK